MQRVRYFSYCSIWNHRNQFEINVFAGIILPRFYGDNGFYVELGLQGGSHPNEGYIEIKPSNGTWGGICDDYFGKNDADVICRMLGYSSGSEKVWHGPGLGPDAISMHSFGHGSGEILLDNLDCTGNEDTILECNHRGWGVEDCQDSGPSHEWAGVTCKE